MRKFYFNEIVPIYPKTKVISVTSQEPQHLNDRHNQEKSVESLYPSRHASAKDEALEYLSVFFNFGYFFHYLPYRFKRSPGTGAYTIHTSLAHKIVCALVHVLTLFRFITVLREVQVTHADPTSYFVIARNFATCIYMFTFMFSFWKNQLVFQDIFKEIGSKSQLFRRDQQISANGTIFSIRTIAYLLCILYTLISLMNVVFGHGLLRMSEWSLRGLLEKHATYTRFMFFMEGNATGSDLDLDSVGGEIHEIGRASCRERV